jgi:5-formyltetrahydrofolate cyclo-ligase
VTSGDIPSSGELPRFASKAAAREAVWSLLADRGAARFPFPPTGRIPNFAGARLVEHPLLAGARRVKVNPDAPQLPLRVALLRRGVVLCVPTPRLRSGFLELDPERIDPADLRRAASIAGAARHGRTVTLDDLEPVQAIVTGSVAVAPRGARCGKGHGYGDIEYAILRELGHPAVPVLTTVHELQIVGGFPSDPHDLALRAIATPERCIEVEAPGEGPAGIDWRLLDEAALDAMPVLRELRARGARGV